MKDDGGWAFPGIIENQKWIEHNGIAHPVGEKEKLYICGMSLRQWYAGLAMQGLVASGTAVVMCTKYAFEVADAMIEAGKEGDNDDKI